MLILMNSYQKENKMQDKNTGIEFDLLENQSDTVDTSCRKIKKISLTDIEKSYLGEYILKNINIDLYEGELVSIVGPSGCGKSTIFNIISGIESMDLGSVELNGHLGYMYQKDLLLPYKTIIVNVSLPLVLAGTPKIKARSQVKNYFEVFDLSGYENSYPRQLSGGMKQRANFLRTYVASKDIMLLDEPFGALDSITKAGLIDWFSKVRKKMNSTILLITHDIDEAISLSDRIYVLSTKPATVKKEFILSCQIKTDIHKRAEMKN